MTTVERWRQMVISASAGLVAGAFVAMLRIWSGTLRKETSQLDKLNRYVAEGHQVLAVFWHEKYLPLVPLAKGKHAVVITVATFRGRVIGQFCKRLGYRPVLLPTKAHAHGFPALVQQVREGSSLIAMAVDGPWGPYHRIRSGALNLSTLHGVVLVPVGVASSRKIVLKWRWDKHEVPLPFSRVAVAVGDIIDLSRHDTQGDTARLEEIVRQGLEAADQDARQVLAAMR